MAVVWYHARVYDEKDRKRDSYNNREVLVL